jgi:hypothetical protein
VSKYTHKRYTQRQLTEIFCSQAGITFLPDYIPAWWVNPLDNNSLRLTFHGLKFTKSNLNLTSYEFSLPGEVTNQDLLRLERLFPGPYFLLKRTKIIVFEEQEASMLTLMSGDLTQYLNNLEANYSNK